MPLDTNIPLQAKFTPIAYEIPQPINTMMSMMKFRQLDQENALAAQKMAEYERARTEEEGARTYADTADLSTPEGLAGLNRFGKTGLALRKSLVEAETAGLTQKKTKFDIQKARKDFIAQAQRDISGNPSDAQLTAYAEDLAANDLFTDAEKNQMKAATDRILAMPVSERRTFLASQGASASAIDLKPTVVSSSSSVYDPATKTFVQAPAAPAAPPSMVAEYNFAKTPDGGNFRGSYQDFVTARAAAGRAPAQPRAEVAPTITQIVDPTNPNKMITIDARRYSGGSIGSPGVIGVAGKEPGAALRENKIEAGKTQLADDLANLRASFEALDKMRAIPSTERNAFSNIGSATAATGVGQVLGRFTGTEAQVERDVINSARTRLVNSIKNATGMSAQQLNSNVELQTMLKSISDPGQSVQAALRIIGDIEDAYVKGDGKMPKRGAAGAAPAAVGAPNIDALLNKYK